MVKKSRVTFVILIILVGLAIIATVFFLASRRQQPSITNNGDASDNTIGQSDDETIQARKSAGATEVQLPDSPALAVEKSIRPILKQVFGNLKPTGYSADIYGAGSLLVEYTPTKKPSPSELPNVTKALKDLGYTTTIEHVDSNVGTAMYEGDNYTITVTINTTNSMVGVSYIGK